MFLLISPAGEQEALLCPKMMYGPIKKPEMLLMKLILIAISRIGALVKLLPLWITNLPMKRRRRKAAMSTRLMTLSIMEIFKLKRDRLSVIMTRATMTYLALRKNR